MKQARKPLDFVTLVPEATNFDLIKDIGQIPYTLKMHNKLNTALVSSNIDAYGENHYILQNLPVVKLPNIHPFLIGIIYILKNAKNVNFFNFYYGGRHCYYWSKLYKLLNPSGKVYIKLDMNLDGCNMFKNIPRENKIFEKAIWAADVVSVESDEVYELVTDFTKRPIIIIPNGYMEVDKSLLKSSTRSNHFITVGRLGTPEKATDVLLEAFAKSAVFHDWDLELVGPLDDGFKQTLNKFNKNHPDLTDRIIIKGPIFNKAELYNEYRTARVFVLPSLWEGSPLVCPEALYNGCRMILSDKVPPIKLFTNNLAFGTVVKSGSVDSLCDALVAESKRTYSEAETTRIMEYATQNFKWSNICDLLISILSNTKNDASHLE